MISTSELSIDLVTPAQWDEVIRHFPDHTVFHTWPWIETICTAHKARPALAHLTVDGEPQAVWPIQETKKSLLRVVGSPLPGCSTAYMGPLFTPECDVEAALHVFLSHDLFRRCAFFGVKVLNSAGGGRIDLAPHGFDPVLRFDTYCIDLTCPAETLWENLKGTCRTQIRKAQRMEIDVRPEHDDSFIEEYWAMSLETFAHTNIQPMFSRAFLEAMWKNLFPIDRVRVLSAWYEGQRAATLVLPFDDHTMYYWGGATYDKYRPLPAHNLLHWKAIKLAQRMGLRCYDFISTLGGAGRFKRTFGPQTVTIATHWERTSSRLMKVIKERYEQFLMRRQLIKAVGISTSASQMLPELCVL